MNHSRKGEVLPVLVLFIFFILIISYNKSTGNKDSKPDMTFNPELTTKYIELGYTQIIDPDTKRVIWIKKEDVEKFNHYKKGVEK